MFQSGQPPPVTQDVTPKGNTIAPMFFLFVLIVLSLVLKQKVNASFQVKEKTQIHLMVGNNEGDT